MSRDSRFISRVLRHAPQDANLTLDPHGWANVRDLLRGMKAAGFKTNAETLRSIVADNDKQRFEMSPDGTRIRAVQGHSVNIDLQLVPQVPPDALFHGTATHVLSALYADGILPMKRQHVHLSTTADTAQVVGARHGNPIVLSIDARRMHAEGSIFYQSANGVWLTRAVPTTYFSIYGQDNSTKKGRVGEQT